MGSGEEAFVQDAVVNVQILFVAMLLSALLSGCQATTPEASRSAPRANARPTRIAQRTNTALPPPPTSSALSIKPPPATITINSATQVAGIATYCWQEGNSGLCADAAGVATPQEPLRTSAPVSVTLRLPLDIAPSTLFLDVQPVTPADHIESTAQGYQWWNIYPSETRRDLPLQQVQDINLQVAPGQYVILVQASWQGIGDVTYGFFVQVQ